MALAGLRQLSYKSSTTIRMMSVLSTIVTAAFEDDVPLSFTVFCSTSRVPTTNCDPIEGDVYACWDSSERNRGLWIFVKSRWVPWTPADAVEIDAFGEIVYLAPCPSAGIQWVKGRKRFEHELARTIAAVRPSQGADLAARYLVPLLKQAFFPSLTPAARDSKRTGEKVSPRKRLDAARRRHNNASAQFRKIQSEWAEKA